MSKMKIQLFIPQACNVSILLFIKNLPPCWFGFMLVSACDVMFNSGNLQLHIPPFFFMVRQSVNEICKRNMERKSQQ